MRAIRRLVVCLDGTRNDKGHSTNVQHHFSLASECYDRLVAGDSVTQLKFYIEGIGTGPASTSRDAAFGLSLGRKLRTAYYWLVENFEDASPNKPADEVYIFGFSRGAFAARELVGLVSNCGLLRRGAPLTVDEIWQNHSVLARESEHRNGPLAALFGPALIGARRLPGLVRDPWLIAQDEIDEAKRTSRIPGRRVQDMNDGEELLIRWSRRVQIRYLGLYDTVGAVGLGAPEIPGMQSRLPRHQGVRPSTLIQQCRHALAIDEHRSNFRHTPFVAYIGPNPSEELGRLEGTESTPDRTGARNLVTSLATAWMDRIEQRWFVGAHSNVGGGYQSNLLAHEPLKWILDGACKAGLICEDVSQILPFHSQKLLCPRDSFAEFASPFWTTILRAKRLYRRIDPVPEVRANGRQGENQPGFILSHINEQVDESVVRYWERRSNPPPNLVEYAKRHAARHPRSAMATIAMMPTSHVWMGDALKPYLLLVFWATVAAAGFLVVDQVFNVWPALPPAWLLAVAAGVFALIDWAESTQNFDIAVRGESPPRRAFLDSIYWTRVLGVVLFLFGAIGVLVYLATFGAGALSLADALHQSVIAVMYWVIISLGAGLGVGLGVMLNYSYARSPSSPWRIVVQAGVIGPLIPSVIILICVIVTTDVWRLLGPALDIELPTSSPIEDRQRFAGLLLLLQLALIYFLNALSWAGRPMTRAHLGSIVRLEFRTSPRRVHECLNRWCSMLSGQRPHKSTGCRMRAIVRETLYRDMTGFIPVYSLVFTFGLWFGAWQLGWTWLQGLWLVVPLTAAIADYMEDACHLRFLRLHERDEPQSSLLTWLGAAMTSINLVAFSAEALLTFAIVIAATLRVHESPELYGWRGLVAFAVSLATAAIILGLGIWSVLYRLSTRRVNYLDKEPPTESTTRSLQEEPEVASLM